MSNTRKPTSIRPQQPIYWLALLGSLLLGVFTGGRIYGRGFWFFAVSFLVVGISFLSDRLVFDGETLTRRGLGAWFGALCGMRRELTISEVETITSYPIKSRSGAARYRTMICGAGVKWTIDSCNPHYRDFIKSLLGAVSPHQLDPLSSELLAYWRVGKQPAFQDATGTREKVERWRTVANHLSLDGNLEVASRYFRLGYEHAPTNAHLLYDMARFIRRNVILQTSGHGQCVDRAVERAVKYLRLAGKIAEHEKDAALLERIGETFFELRFQQHARQHFEMAVQVDSLRPRANLGLAVMALQNGQAAKAVHHYGAAARGAQEAGVASLANLAERKADYYHRLLGDDEFLSAEASRQNLLTQLKWGRRAALVLFVAAWLLQVGSYQFTSVVHNFSREISATAAVMWIVTTTATHLFSQRRS